MTATSAILIPERPKVQMGTGTHFSVVEGDVELGPVENEDWCAALVEFALVAPIFFLLMLGIIEAGRFILYYQTLANATREGARYAIVHGANSYCPSGPMPVGVNPPLGCYDATGARIAFQSDRDGNIEIYTMNGDGAAISRVTSHTAVDVYPSWGGGGQSSGTSALTGKALTGSSLSFSSAPILSAEPSDGTLRDLLR